MKTRLTPYYINLIYNACLHSFWRKKSLSKFLHQCGVSESFLAGWAPEETKRDILDRLFVKLPTTDNGRVALLQMAKFLMEQQTYPDLGNWEDYNERVTRSF